MNAAGLKKLAALGDDFASISGAPWSHFYCPVLYRDEPVELCRAHVINRAFRGSDRKWTIQRADVDGFFGSLFEKEFLAFQEKGRHSPIEVLLNRDLARLLKPRFVFEGEIVEHYLLGMRSPPKHHSAIELEDRGKVVRLALKMPPEVTAERFEGAWTIEFGKDVRLPALVALLKAAHLTLFELLGYSYVLSLTGHFLGRTILGDFYDAAAAAPRERQLEMAAGHFPQFVNLVRPILKIPEHFTGTLTDRNLLLAWDDLGPWATIVLLRTDQSLHAVLVPTLERPDSMQRLMGFLQKPPRTLDVRQAVYREDRWEYSTDPIELEWPDANYHLQG